MIRSALSVLALLLWGTAWPQDVDRVFLQFNHRAYTAADGAPDNIYALAQTTDGTLWIGGGNGLTRFDGIHFVSYPGPSEEPLPSTDISTLRAAPDGSLWMGFRTGGIAILKSSHVTTYDAHDGVPGGAVDQFAWDLDGTAWVVARAGLAYLRGSHWEVVADEKEFGFFVGAVTDRFGTVWFASVKGLFARPRGEKAFRVIADTPFEFTAGPIALGIVPDGRIWASPAGPDLMIVNPGRSPQPGDYLTIRGFQSRPVLFDREGNLWEAATTARLGVIRWPADQLPGANVKEMKVTQEHFAWPGILRSGASFLLLDREGNIWVGGQASLERFNRNSIAQQAVPPCANSSYIRPNSSLVAGDAGSIWTACTAWTDKSGNTSIQQSRDGAVIKNLAAPDFTVSYRDPQGTPWFGGPNAIGHLEDGRLVTTPLPDRLLGSPIQAMVRDRTGALWVSVVRHGIFRVADGDWSEYGHLDALPRGPAIVASLDGDGALWFGYPHSQMARVKDGVVQLFGAAQGLELGNVFSIAAQDGRLWVGGELGFAWLDGTRFRPVRCESGILFKGISGIVRAPNGDFWLNGIPGIVHITRQEIEHLLQDPVHPVQCEIFNYLDGVPGTAIQFRPQPSAIEGTDGRLYFITTGGIATISATGLVRNTLPPPVTIWSVVSGKKTYPNTGTDLRLPEHTTNLQIDYSAGSLTVPERVRFRYRLQGLDRDWQDVGERREALYTNLRPGEYTFQVIASNNDGVWNQTGASIRLDIAPAYYQTRWFYALCVFGCLAVLYGLYRLRLRQVAAQVHGRLEARLAERERIARELHDTLLQGIQGLIWRFQAAADRIPSGEPARELMEQSLDRADKLLGESRDKVKDLRPDASQVADLAQALALEGEQLAQLHPVRFRVSVQSARRELHPIVREEGFQIACEALRNAFQHSGAADIEAEITYDPGALHIRIRDSGKGITTEVLNTGRSGHFGLVGMRERAKKLAAHLDVWSKQGAGTEVELRVPAKVAYRKANTGARGIRAWLERVWHYVGATS